MDQYIYTPLEEAKAEIWHRWNNESLKKEVVGYLGGFLPEFFSAPRAILVRDVATPDVECMHFVDLAQKIDLMPTVFEGSDDKFVSLASDKMGLVKLSFFDGYDKNHHLRHHYKKIIDIPANDGKIFNEINTLWGENLVDFHHRLLNEYVPQKVELFDDLQWYRETIGGSTMAKDYYKILLAFFVVHGIQFENYITDESEQGFFEEVVKPAFDFVTEKFGVRPLITPLAPYAEASNPYWWCYKAEIENSLGGKKI